jgi:signal transduction histidine kinase
VKRFKRQASVRQSIVPSLLTPPTSPLRMVGLFVASSYAVAGVLGLFTLLAAPFVLALPGVSPTAIVRIALVQGLVSATVLLVLSFVGVHKMRPIYLTLIEGPRDTPTGQPPPEAAVRWAFAWPERAVWINTAITQLVPVLDAVGVISVSGLSGWSRLSVDLLSIAVAGAGLMPSIVVFRQIVWRWLGRLHPTDISQPCTEHFGRRLSLTVTLPVAVVGLSAVVVLASHLVALRARVAPYVQIGTISVELDLTAAVLATAIIVASTALSWMLARRLGERLARDLTALTEQIDLLQRGEMRHADMSLAGTALEDLPAFARTEPGRELAIALSELGKRFGQMREKEREGRLAMEQVQRLRTQFLASMSHDLRSPLNSILGFATLIASGSEGPVTGEQRESIQMITRAARDLLRLVTNILDSARLEAGRLELRRAWTPSVEILTLAVAEGRRMIGDRPLEIEAELQPGLPPVYADADRVVQAVVGLFSHAIDAMESGVIRLVAGIAYGPPGPNRFLRVDVVDRGAGIREADKETLFEAFREVQEPSGKRIGGLGLGLSLARELVKAHGGDVWFETQAGRGTTFTVAIPLEEEEKSGEGRAIVVKEKRR